MHGHSAEGITHLERTLAAAGNAPPLLRGRALHALGILRSQRVDERTEATFREGLAMFRAAGDQARVAVALNSLGVMARERGDTAGARAAFEDASDAYRSLDDRRRLADSLSNLAFVAIDEQQLDDAAALFSESIALDRAFANDWGVAQNLSGQAVLALARGAPDEAAALLAEAVQTLRRLGDRLSLVTALDRLAATAAVRNDHAFAARLWGAATAQRDAAGEPRTAGEAATTDRYVDVSRAALGPERFAAAATGGAALELDAALAEALAG
jgi:tetratricopeptide (TPR) repeat protein